jgi:aminopeptidase N
MAEEWFYVASKGIAWYEECFSTLYPFGKLDHVFVADYNMGAMENVGCIIYTETYI